MISVIIPVFNSEKYLQNTLDSLRNQTYSDFEAIIIDDGSTDSSGLIADEYAKNDKRFRVIHVANSGVSKARNLGIEESVGEWIYCLDSDDVMEKTMLQSMIEASYENDMVVSSISVEMVAEKKSISVCNDNIVLKNKDEIGNYLVSMDGTKKDLLLNYLWNRLMKRDIIVGNNIRFNEEVQLGEDFLFICEYLKFCKSVILLNQCLYKYYIRPNSSLAGKFNINEHARRLLMREAFSKLLNSFKVFEKSYDGFAQNEGRYSIYGIEKLNLNSCSLVDTKSRCAYIKSFLGNEDISYMRYYLKTAEGKSNSVWRILIRIKSAYLIHLYLKVRKKIIGAKR